MVEQAPEGGYTARALGESIFTEADTEAELRLAVQDGVHCHFDENQSPKIIRLHFARDELLAAQGLPRDMEAAQTKNERAVLGNDTGALVCGVAGSSQ